MHLSLSVGLIIRAIDGHLGDLPGSWPGAVGIAGIGVGGPCSAGAGALGFAALGSGREHGG